MIMTQSFTFLVINVTIWTFPCCAFFASSFTVPTTTTKSNTVNSSSRAIQTILTTHRIRTRKGNSNSMNICNTNVNSFYNGLLFATNSGRYDNRRHAPSLLSSSSSLGMVMNGDVHDEDDVAPTNDDNAGSSTVNGSNGNSSISNENGFSKRKQPSSRLESSLNNLFSISDRNTRMENYNNVNNNMNMNMDMESMGKKLQKQW